MTDSNIIPTQSLNMEPTQTPNVPPIPIPNRYHTTVCVEYVIDDDVRHLKWFSDIQMAWIWIREQVNRRDDREEWEVIPFLTTADAMDREWRRNRGVIVADCDEYEYCAYYEPTVLYEAVRDREEYF
jgi:hypothetical protein